MKQKYGELESVLDPGLLGSVLASSQSEEYSVAQLIQEFSIELVDDYYTRSSKAARGRTVGR